MCKICCWIKLSRRKSKLQSCDVAKEQRMCAWTWMLAGLARHVSSFHQSTPNVNRYCHRHHTWEYQCWKTSRQGMDHSRTQGSLHVLMTWMLWLTPLTSINLSLLLAFLLTLHNWVFTKAIPSLVPLMTIVECLVHTLSKITCVCMWVIPRKWHPFAFIDMSMLL